MVSTLNLDEKYNRVRRNFCFYLDIQDHGLARSLSRRIQDMGLQQEVFLTSRVTHVVREAGGGAGGEARTPPCARRDGRRADAMLESVRRASRAHHAHGNTYLTLSVHKAINLLDKLYDTFFAASRKTHVRLFTKHFIKIEFLDKSCRPIFKEFEEWPAVSLEPDPPRDKRDSPDHAAAIPALNIPAENKMTRKGRARKEAAGEGGYCEMCNTEYADAGAHRRSPHHRAFVRDATNFLALDSLIAAGADVSAFLNKATPVNGERRSQRNVCNGSPEPRGRRRPEPEPRHNGHAERRPRARADRPRHYYKVVGAAGKLRSGGGCARRALDPPQLNGAEPLVVKFRKVRRSELSVLSDEAEQFMFPKRASSSSSSEDEERAPPPPPAAERRRLARPLALKEESSEEDSWPEDARRRKRRAPGPGRRARRLPCKAAAAESHAEAEPPTEPSPDAEPAPAPSPPAAGEASPLREVERCMRWEDGRLKYTPAVEQLEFAFESVPRSEPWYESFARQDQDKVLAKNVPNYFALYSTSSPKLPYELGQLPPLKPNCCALSELVKPREEKAGPSRSYGTRGMKKQKIRKRTAALIALEGHPRKSPREHASTLAILGSAGLLQRRKLHDDTKSTASEDTLSDAHSCAVSKPEPADGRAASERLQRFLCDVFSEADGLEECEPPPAAAHVTPAHNAPDLSSLLSECDARDPLRDQLQDAAAPRPRARRARFKKKNRTGWPNKKKQRKGSRTDSSSSSRRTEAEEALGRSSAEPADDDTRDALEAGDEARAADDTPHCKSEEESAPDDKTLTEDTASDTADAESGGRSASSEDRELRKKRRALQGLCDWLPVVRVARVDPAATRRLRSAARPRPARIR